MTARPALLARGRSASAIPTAASAGWPVFAGHRRGSATRCSAPTVPARRRCFQHANGLLQPAISVHSPGPARLPPRRPRPAQRGRAGLQNPDQQLFRPACAGCFLRPAQSRTRHATVRQRVDRAGAVGMATITPTAPGASTFLSARKNASASPACWPWNRLLMLDEPMAGLDNAHAPGTARRFSTIRGAPYTVCWPPTTSIRLPLGRRLHLLAAGGCRRQFRRPAPNCRNTRTRWQPLAGRPPSPGLHQQLAPWRPAAEGMSGRAAWRGSGRNCWCRLCCH